MLRGHTDVAAFGDTIKRASVGCALAKSCRELFAVRALLLHHSDAAREACGEKRTLQLLHTTPAGSLSVKTAVLSH